MAKKTGGLFLGVGLLGMVAVFLSDLFIKGEPRVTLGPKSAPVLGIALLIAVAGIVLLSREESGPEQ